MDHQSSNNKDFRFELVKARKRIAELERQLPPQGQPASSVTADSDRQNSFNDIRLLIDSTTEFIWIIDTEKRLVLANEALREHFLDNFTLDMQPGMTSANLLTTEQADYFDLLFDKALHGQSLKLNHSCQNGKTYAVTIQPLKKSEKIIGVSGFARDVSKQSQAQQELRNFEQIVSSTPDMVSLVDRDYRYHIVNDAYLNNFQLRREDIVGKTVASLVGEKLFNEISKPSLDKAFAGEIAHIEAWLEIPVLGRRFLAMTFHPLRGQELSPNFVAIDARDMTDLKRAEEDRQQIFAVSLDMLCVAGFDGYFKELNPAWPRVLGWSIEELKSKPWLDFMAKEDQQITIETGQRLLSGQQVIGFENRIICKDGSLKWMSWNAVPELERQRFVASIRDVTARKQLDDELRQMAMTDPLTGANNRRHFIDLAAAELKRSRRYGRPLAVIIMDINYFKQVNDRYGHDAGDEVLVRLVDSCLQELRQTDIFGRFGGEEFAAILIETDEEAALKTCQRLSRQIEDLKIRTRHGNIQITVSIGFTMFSADDFSVDPLLKRADDALYRAKNQGHKQIVKF